MKKDLTFHHEEFNNVSKEAKDFVRKFITRNPDDRIKLETAINDPWLADPLAKMESINLSSHSDVVDRIKK